MNNILGVYLDNKLYKKTKFLGFFYQFYSICFLLLNFLGFISMFMNKGIKIYLSLLKAHLPNYILIVVIYILLFIIKVIMDVVNFRSGLFYKKALTYRYGDQLKKALLLRALHAKLSILSMIISLIFVSFYIFAVVTLLPAAKELHL